MFNPIHEENFSAELRAICPELRGADSSLIRTFRESCDRYNVVLSTNYSGALAISVSGRAPIPAKLADVVRRCQILNRDEQAEAEGYKLLRLEEEAEELDMLQEALQKGREHTRSVIISLGAQIAPEGAPRYRNLEEYQTRMMVGNSEMDDLEAMA